LEYQQLDKKANRHIEGTGLGLTITKNLISLMNGTINVESEYGKGSAFTVKIPQRIINETPIGGTVARNLENFRFKDNYSSKNLRLERKYMPYGKVLVVDDVKTNLDVARGLLMPYGLSIDTASSGQEAISKIRAVCEGAEVPPYDIIFMDHMMPVMDGIETVRILRNNLPGDYGKKVPIIALTANAIAGNEEMFFANGFNAFISKPINIFMLDKVLNTWVQNKESLEALTQAEMENSGKRKENPDTVFLDDITLDGIDLLKGRDLYSSETTYLEILRSWYISTPGLLEKIRYPSNENLPEYAITVHGIKGSSFGICAGDIGNKAEELEHYAKNRIIDRIQAENPAFIEMVELLLEKLGNLLKKTAGSKEEKQKISVPEAALLDSLMDAAKRYKSTLMEEIIGKLESYEYDSGGELVVWLREQMDNLEYDTIRQRLESRE
jgi:CheY-like chemotaxis protein